MNELSGVDSNAVRLVEKKRKKLRWGDRFGYVMALILWILCLSLAVQGIIHANIFIFGNLIFPIAAVWNAKKNNRLYMKFYKSHLITPLLKKILPQFEYKPFGVINSDVFCNSLLFKQDMFFSRYGGGDHFFNKTIALSGLDVTKRIYSSSRKSHSKSLPIFQGVFLIATLPKSLSSKLTLSNKACGRIEKKTLKRFKTEETSQRSIKLTTGNREFDNSFIIQSQDPGMARFLRPEEAALITSLSQSLSTKQKSPSPVSVVLSKDQINIAIGGVKLFDTKSKRRTESSLEQLNSSIEFIQTLIKLVSLWVETV